MTPTTRYNLHSPMPWGKHKGWPMRAVPAQYLHWLWHSKGLRVDKVCPVAGFIREHMMRLVRKDPSLRWNNE